MTLEALGDLFVTVSVVNTVYTGFIAGKLHYSS